MQDVLVSIKGYQKQDDDINSIEMIAVGKYQKTDNGAVAVYNETEESGLNTRVLLKYENNGKLIIERSGSLNSKMVIERGKRNQNFYRNAHSNFLMGIYGEHLFSELKNNGGFISAEYQIDINGAVISKNKIEISLKEAKNNVNGC